MAQPAPAGGAPAAHAATAVTWARTPATSTADIIDYSTKYGQTVYYKAVAPLDLDSKFDCSKGKLHHFLGLLEVRALETGWTDTILAILVDSNNVMGPTKNFFRSYGTHSLEHLRDQARHYHPAHSRASQESFQLYKCLYESLTPEGRNKVTMLKKQYMIGDEQVGVLFLKLIISKSSTQSNATSMSIRKKLNRLGEYIENIDFNIVNFNEYVAELLEGLESMGQKSTDLLPNLFDAYSRVPDQAFQRYMHQKESDYEEGDITLTPEELLGMALNKFMTIDDKRVWRKRSEEEEQIVTLTAKIERLEGELEASEGNDKAPKANKGSKANKFKKADKEERADDAWKLIPPMEGEPSTKKVGKTEWFFCQKHKRWGHHTTKECTGVCRNTTTTPSEEQEPKAKPNENSKSQKDSLHVKAQNATFRFSKFVEASDDSDDE